MAISDTNPVQPEGLHPLIGIFGGTFDPIHFGHLRMAQEVLNLTPMEELRFVPCQTPPHRETPDATPAERLHLLETALEEGDPRFYLDTREMDREGPSYMVDTLRSLRHELGPLTPIGLILGQDAVQGLPGWSRWEQLLEIAHLILLKRPGYSLEWPEALSAAFRDRLTQSPPALQTCANGLVLTLEVSQLEISASHIRALIRTGESPRYLLPRRVFSEIQRLGLYRSN